MEHLRIRLYLLLLVLFALAGVLAAALPRAAEAGDAGVGRRMGGIAEIDLVSAVNGSTVVRSLPTQEGAPQGFGALSDVIRILDLATGVALGNGNTSADGQYAVVLPNKPLVTGQGIQAFNVTRGFYSSGVTVSVAQPPAIDEPVLPGAVLIKGRGTPGSSIQIRHAVTGALLGTGIVVAAFGPTNGTFSIKLNRSLPLFHSIQAVDVTKGRTGRTVPVLNLLTGHSSLLPACGVNQAMNGGFLRKTFSCGLPRPRGVTLDANGNPLIAAGTAPLDPGYALLPAGLFRLVPATGALSLFAPVNGVALKRGPGGAFGADVFVVRPRFFNVRGKVLVQPGEGEIFRVNVTNSQIQVFTRLFEFAPTGMAFGGVGSPFPNELLVSNFLEAGLRRIKATGSISTFTKLSGLQGLAFGPGGAFGSDLYAAQPGSGGILRIAANGIAASFATGMTSPMDVAFGIGGAFGTDLYVADAGGGKVLRIESAGKQTTFASGLKAPFGLAFRASPPALFVTDYLDGSVVQFTPS
jgi:DNA-binding beta-propeller fold protein YncE